MTFSNLKKIGPRKPLGHEVYKKIKTAILKGELPPGGRLVEEQLSESLGASRTPIRQAMHMLERDGLIERQKRGGFHVRPLSVRDVEELLDLRCVLESFAALKALENINPKALDLLTRKNEAFGRAVENGEPLSRLADLNTEFHEALYDLAGNRRLRQTIQDLNDHFYRYRLGLLGMQDMARTSYEDHREMIQAMSDGDAERTDKLVKAHIEKGKNTMIDALGGN